MNTTIDPSTFIDGNRCKLCRKEFFPGWQLLRHIYQKHINHKCSFNGIDSLLCFDSCSNDNKGHYHCPNCNYTNKDKNRLKTHTSKHKMKSQSTKSDPVKKQRVFHSLSVDLNNGLYMVSRKNLGDDIPLHVIAAKNSNDSSIRYECTFPSCQEAMELTWANGSPQYLCQHISRIIPESCCDTNNWIYDDIDLSSFSEKEKKLFKSHQQELGSKKVDPVKFWPHSSYYKYFSVLCKPNKTFPHGRLFVKFDIKKEEFKCDCRKASKIHNCIHVLLTKIYIKKENLTLSNVIKSSHHASYKTLSDEEVDYQLKMKQYPPEFEKSLMILEKSHYETIKLEKLLKPSETVCHNCKVVLSEDLLLTNKAIICDVKSITTDVPIYYKICSNCKMRYFYKEFKDGVHVSNSLLILSLTFCIYTRHFLKSSTSSGRTGKVILDFLCKTEGTKPVSDQDFRDSYANFELMTNHQYNFHCNICGVYPSVLMTDVCRKAFCDINADTLSKICDGEKDVQRFWNDIGKAIMKRRDSDLVENWSQWQSPSNLGRGVSSEAQKGSKKGFTSIDNLMLSPEEINDIFDKQPKNVILKYLNDLGIRCDKNGSKSSLLSKLIQTIYGDDAFNKKLFSVPGGSGGWLAFTCTHGIVYYLKMLLRHESPSDYTDALMSFKFKPAAVICDMPDKIARNMHKRCPNMLQSHLGMLGPPTAENITKAKEGKFKRELPCLQVKAAKHPISLDHQYTEENPITGTSKIFILYDQFHKVNTKKESERLRHVDCVPQLKNINTEISEQLNSVIGRNQYFLNRMDLAKHYFFLRLLIHLLNEDRNEKNKENILRINKNCNLKSDWFGRQYLSKQSVNADTNFYMSEYSSSENTSCNVSMEDINSAYQFQFYDCTDAKEMNDVSNLSSNEPPTKAVSHEITPDDLDMFTCTDISNARQLESDAMDDVSNLSSNEPPTRAVSHENTPNDGDMFTCADISNACQLESDAMDDASNLSSNEPPTKAVSHENTPDDLDIISCEDISNARQLESDAMDDVSNLSSNEPPTKAVSHENTPDDGDM